VGITSGEQKQVWGVEKQRLIKTSRDDAVQQCQHGTTGSRWFSNRSQKSFVLLPTYPTGDVRSVPKYGEINSIANTFTGRYRLSRKDSKSRCSRQAVPLQTVYLFVQIVDLSLARSASYDLKRSRTVVLKKSEDVSEDVSEEQGVIAMLLTHEMGL
jgi:hypothetical protein